MGIVAGTLRARQLEDALKAGRLDPAEVRASGGAHTDHDSCEQHGTTNALVAPTHTAVCRSYAAVR